MEQLTRRLWELQNRHEADRHRLFAAVEETTEADNVLYPGCFVDVSASFVFPKVTYVDTDDRAARFFGDEAGVGEILAGHATSPTLRDHRFIHADYRTELGIADDSFDLLVSLYAGFVSEHCTRYLRIGGTLLVNPSHGDVAMASIDERLRLAGAVKARRGGYHATRTSLDSYLISKRGQPVDVESLHRTGRGIGYTRSAFAYLFERIA